MAFAATFEAADSRVRLQVTGETLSFSVTFMKRITGTTSWDIVRGGFGVVVTGGTSPPLYDVEFPAGPNPTQSTDYRASLSSGTTLDVTVSTSIAAQAWLKFIGFPYLNRQITITDYTPITRSGRSALHQVVATRTAVAVQDYMAARRVEIEVRTDTWSDWVALDNALSAGGIVFLHADEADLGLPNLYAVVSSTSTDRGGRHSSARKYTRITLDEVTKPQYLYAGAIGTYQSVITNHPDYTDVATDYATYGDLLEIEGSAADVIVS
jgi:hypothetical protein